MLVGPRRWAFLGGAAFALVWAGWALHRGELLALALPLLGYLAVGYARPPTSVELRAERTLSTKQAASGESVQITLEIHNRSQYALEIVEIQDSLPQRAALVRGVDAKIVALEREENTLIEYAVSARRGLLRWSGVRVIVSDTLGLYRQVLEIPCESELLVLPAFEKISRLWMRPRRTRIYSGQVKARLGGPGLEFFGVRDYYPGDPQRYLNWKATARRDRPILNEFEQERVVDVILLLDARERSDIEIFSPSALQGEGRGGGWESLFEYSVEAALALAHALSVQGNRVGLLIYGNFLNWTWPGYGRRQRERLLRAIASAEKGDKAVFEDLENLPTRLLPAGSQLIFVSPLCESDIKTLLDLRLRYEVLVISPDPVSFEGRALLSEKVQDEVQLAMRIARLRRTALLTQLRRAGVRVLDWDVARPLAPLVDKQLGRLSQRAGVVRGRAPSESFL
ncbi:MAG: DUF58 domain-containing protein [Candidatus Bipolaricaulota bacterium]|nr:DUF58 domain-containing protein [Candidatus Bipolaricaulota bacterium]MCS7275277.1 DUF58 domain-containing protein [Candidatus Bipolaricaulota bacterium]MDW8111543.1 DUF58 domain-containing protein [Candidatus Bipolaricaulota bacterium]MDW8329431.1 DUF58 domain-containing protein [Candidatus Bipolaricaulota bacterium]